MRIEWIEEFESARYDYIVEIEKRGNPYHDPVTGRFAPAPGGGKENNASNKHRRVTIEVERKRDSRDIPTYYLPSDEYAMVMTELRTNLVGKHTRREVGSKIIGKNIYVYEADGKNDYRIIGKKRVKNADIVRGDGEDENA